MTNTSRFDDSSHRDILEASAAGVIGLSTGMLPSSAMAAQPTDDKYLETAPGRLSVADQSKAAFYLVRVTQEDKQKGWTSPIWIGWSK